MLNLLGVIVAQESGGGGGGAAFVLFLAFLVGMVWLVRKVMGPPKQVTPASGADRSVLFTPEDGDPANPWLERIFKMQAYGLVPDGIAEMMRQVSPEDEKVFGAVSTQHGRWKAGYLVATTSYIRWVQTRITKHNDFFPYDSLEKVSAIGSRNVIVVGNLQFQVRSAKRAKEFIELEKAIIQAMNWSAGRQAEVEAAASHRVASGTAEELERLAALHANGALDDDEYAQAKRRLLG